MSNYNEPPPTRTSRTNALIGIVVVIVVVVAVLLFMSWGLNPEPTDIGSPTSTISDVVATQMPEVEPTVGDSDTEMQATEVEMSPTPQG